MKIHPVFHISLRELYQNHPLPSQNKEPPPASETEGEPEYELDEIIDSRLHYGNLQYRAKWTGYSPEHDKTCYPANNFENAESLRKQFHVRYQRKPGMATHQNRRIAQATITSQQLGR